MDAHKNHMKIFASQLEDAHQGWVWIQDSTLPPRSVIRIQNKINNKVVYCEALQIDKNFLDQYNAAPRISICNPQGAIVLNAWYRAKLGGLQTQEEASIEVHRCNSFWGKFKACTDHPQTVVRVATWLGGIGLFLGVVGLLLGIISIWPSSKS
jgi:hypothetical protein